MKGTSLMTIKPNDNGMWKIIAMVAISVVITGASFWIVVGRDLPNKVEVIELIKDKSPYVKDQKALQVTLDEIVRRLDRIEKKVDK